MRALLKLLAYYLKHRNSPFPVPDTDVHFWPISAYHDQQVWPIVAGEASGLVAI